MDVFRRLALAFFAGILFLPLETNAQGLTGSLVGTVQDANGGVIPGALVRVISPALIGGARQTLSSDRGQWRIQILPPGAFFGIAVLLALRNRLAGARASKASEPAPVDQAQ